ncbi:MAG TPA: hypothetical protein VFO65_02095, partial [Acidimicrobiales bacterium]|nr:hypothetical protein [Acidimicrobiales bacterium]
TADQRRAATVLHRALVAARGAADPEAVMREVVAGEPRVELDYAAERDGRLLIAARVGPVRLIDNLAREDR